MAPGSYAPLAHKWGVGGTPPSYSCTDPICMSPQHAGQGEGVPLLGLCMAPGLRSTLHAKRKQGQGVTDSPLPACAGAIYHEESCEEPPMDLPSEEDVHFWTYGDRQDEETVSRIPEDAEELEDAKEPEDAEDGEISWLIARMIAQND